MPDQPTMQEIIRRRLETGFVGRQDLLARFQENVGLTAGARARRFIVNVHGEPGAGKTWLVHQLERVALESGARVGHVDEHVFDVPGAMAAIAAQLRRQHAPLRAFERRHRHYEERRAALLVDVPSQNGASLLLARLAVRLGLRAARTVPVAGTIAEFVEPDLMEQADSLHSLLARVLRSRDDVRLVLAPTEELSPLFVDGLRRAAIQHPVALFFDGYHHLAPVLDTWLLDLVRDGGPYGELPGNLTIIVAGREPLDPRRWADLLTEIEPVEVGPFSDAEARQLLALKNVRDEAVIAAIYALSGRVPLLVATLAEGSPIDPAMLTEPGGDAVEHFLRWLADPRRREIALLAALPRSVDEDVLTTLTGDGDAAELYEWLRALPFVQERDGACEYHELVRAPLLHRQRRRGAHRWRQNHRRLAEHNERCREELELPDPEGWGDDTWQRYALEETYHRLCATPVAGLPAALADVLRAYQAARPLARRWAEMLRQAGEDTESPEIAHWGAELAAAAGEDEDCWPVFVTALLDRAALEPADRALGLGQRAECHAVQQRFDEALADFDQAIALDPDSAELVAARAQTLRAIGRFDEALADLDQAIELAPESEAAIASRGVLLSRMGRLDDAIADLDRAIALRPADDWALSQRGDVHRKLGQALHAVADYTEAIRLTPDYKYAYAGRGLARRRLGHHHEELADLTRAVELDPEYAFALANRGVTHRGFGRYEDALADLDRVIALEPDYIWALANRGVTRRQMGRYEDALADLDRAIELEPRYAWAIANRGETLHLLGRDDEALAALDRALVLRPDTAWTLARRGEVRRRLGERGALEDFERALELDSADGLTHYGRGLLLLGSGRSGEAAAELEAAAASGRRSLERRPGDPAGLLRLAVYEAARGRAAAAPPLCREALAHGASGPMIEATLRELRALAALAPDDGAGIQALVELLRSGGQE